MLRSNQMSINGGWFADENVQEEKSTEDHCPFVPHSRDIVTTRLQKKIQISLNTYFNAMHFIMYNNTYVPKLGTCISTREMFNLSFEHRSSN